MRLLGIDTTGKYLSLVLINGEDIIIKKIDGGKKKHTSVLMPAVDALLTETNLAIGDLNYVSAIVGPGSFTGIRVGVSSANAIAYSLDIPMIEVTSLELIAYNKADGVALIDAMHGNFYGGTIKDGEITEMRYYEMGDVISGDRYYQDEDNDYGKEYAAILVKKAKRGEVKETLLPVYLRESQAEREAAKK